MKAQISTFSKSEIAPEQVCFVYHNDKLLMLGDRLPTRGELDLSLDANEAVFKMKEGWAISGTSYTKKTVPGKLEFRSLKEVLPTMAIPMAKDAGLAAQLINWADGAKCCGSCGKKTVIGAGAQASKEGAELAKHCPDCERTVYPTLTPVVIVLIKRGKEVLLAKGLPPKKFFSCLSGFTEPAETLEETIRREVKEEVGVEVKNIKYFGSQPWPFPNNMMIGFTADWIAGDIKADPNEITDARWFSREELHNFVEQSPYAEEGTLQLPGKISIARAMIEAFKKGTAI